MNLPLTLTVVLVVFTTVLSKGLREEFTWTRVNYVWPRQRITRQSYHSHSYGSHSKYGSSDGVVFPEDSGAPNRDNNRPSGAVSGVPYTYQNNIPMGANTWNNKLFITVPRRRLGVPSTVNYVWINSSVRHNAPLIPYPDWETNVLGGSSPQGYKFVSVYRVAVDSCDRLWFVDTGRIEIPGNPTQVQATSIVVMDLRTDQIIRRHVFNSSVLTSTTNLASVTVDSSPYACDDAYAYMPDLSGYGLVVYSLRDNRSWRVTHNYFFVEPMAGEFSVGGHNFQWNDGVFSIALSSMQRDGSREAYFHSMAGTHLYRVNTSLLKNETTATRSYHGDDFQSVGDRGPLSQTSASDLHQTKNILFLGLVNQNALACWNTRTSINDISIVQRNNQTMIYPCDVKVRGDNVILLTNNMPIFLYGTLDYNVTNFRVWIENVDKAIEGTKCAVASSAGYRKQGSGGTYY